MVKTMKSSLFKCCLAILALAALNVLVPVAYAQSPVSGGGISGIVSDDQGPLVGAAVMVKGSTGGVSTGLDGEYALSGVKKGDIIVFSLLGYNDVEIVYDGQPTLNATLEVSSEFLDEEIRKSTDI